MKAGEITARAGELVSGDRNEAYGDVLINHGTIAAIWSGYLEARQLAGKPSRLSAEDVTNMMEALKIGRRLTGTFHIDNYVDGAGYAACAGEIASRLNAACSAAAERPGSSPDQSHFRSPG